MTLIATPGATANSYADVVFADEYIATHDPDLAWFNIAPVIKESLLQRATELLDELRWQGSKSDSVNSLRWPRLYVYDKEGIQLDGTTVPLFLKRAASEFAFHLSEGDTTREAGFKLIQIGPLKMESGDEQLSDQDPIPAQIRRMISFYLEPSGPSLVRG